MNYKDSGVDIEAGRYFVDQIKDTVKSTHSSEVMGGFGGFNGMMRIPAGYKKPVLVSGTDGVGTKLHVVELECHGEDKSLMQGIGIDLVAMCVNDVITCGAKPLYFLDYICTSGIEKYGDYLKHIVHGIASGCKYSGCSLLGGETAEHPQRLSMVPPVRDISGFCTGIIEENEILDGRRVTEGDVIIGIESSGLHSNGYSLIRDMLFHHKIKLKDNLDLLNTTVIYAPLVDDLLNDFPILAMANITGGGIPENLPRCFPKGLKPNVNYDSWPMPKLFSKIMLAGEIPEEDMKNTFNMGIGYCLVVPEEAAEGVQLRIFKHGLQSWIIGEVNK